MRRAASLHPRAFVRGFTLLELLIVVTITAVLLSLLLPNVRSSRGAARRMSCANNLKQLGLALHNYHSTHGHLPAAMGGTDGGPSPRDGNANRLSGLVALLPFLEQQGMWEQISAPLEIAGSRFPAMGPAPWISEYPPWRSEIPVLRCASDERSEEELGMKNYAFCIGDVARQIHNPSALRGAFACRMTSRFEDIKDGSAHTIAMAEIGTRKERSVAGQYAIHQAAGVLDDPRLSRRLLDSSDESLYVSDVPLSPLGRGGCWADGAAGHGLFNTVLPPNRPSCAVRGADAAGGLYATTSYHPNGTQVLFVDGSVRFMTDDVDVGDESHPTLSPEQLAKGAVASPHGVWGALGTAAGNDSMAAP